VEMKIVVWLDNPGGGDFASSLNQSLEILKNLYGEIKIVGGIIPEEVKTTGIAFLDKEDLKILDFDLILVADNNPGGEAFFTGNDSKRESFFTSVLHEAEELNIDTDKIIADRIILVPNFTLEKYKKLRRSKLSILSMNCWGGLTYHRFGLPFLSPTINMFTDEQSFLKFLKNPVENVKSELELVDTKFNEELGIEYPVFKIGEVEWNMNHYGDFEMAKRKWFERSQRINWFNTFVTMYTESYKVLAEFDKLPFAKKVCFVPFDTDLDSGFYLDTAQLQNPELWRVVNGIAEGRIVAYDMWDMLLYGKKTLLT